MAQYETSGPPTGPVNKNNQELERSVKNLQDQVERQDRVIKELEKTLRKLRNDMRMAVATANTINSNNRRNG